MATGAAFTAKATATGGDGTYTYQWKLGTANVAAGKGGNTDTLNIASAAAGDAGSYTVVITDGTGATKTSAAITLTVS